MILEFLAVSDLGADAVKILLGSGGTAGAMFLWVKREIQRGDRALDRSDEIADKAIAALTQVNTYLADTSKHLEKVGGSVGREHEKTREHVTNTIRELKTDGEA